VPGRRRHHAWLASFGVLIGLVCVGVVAMATNDHTTSDDGLLPPVPATEPVAPQEAQGQPPPGDEYAEHENGAAPVPRAASLAGPAATVVRRFAEDWANRNSVLTPAIKREMVGLSAGAWANAVFQQARLTLPAIEHVRAAGGMVMMKLTTVVPGSKTALVVTQERLLDPDGELAPPSYALYLARLDRVTPRGYAITAWEPQQ
jgi:hypothetical protein